ncbi:MAG: hypothetical protein BWX59_01598 [Bacteroidetes bacterium ADurb.Bin028]|nr:MAG: hypothetical protein BWX59_01598 [Bacteroidetes bacterium ADurb.Bin028]
MWRKILFVLLIPVFVVFYFLWTILSPIFLLIFNWNYIDFFYFVLKKYLNLINVTIE